MHAPQTQTTLATMIETARREDGPAGYRAIDGDWVAIPPRVAPPENGPEEVKPHVSALSLRAGTRVQVTQAEALRRLSGGATDARADSLADRIARVPGDVPRDDPRDELLWAYLQAPGADLRWLEHLDLTDGAHYGHPAERRPLVQGDLMRAILAASDRHETGPSAFQNQTLWPLVAENLTVFDEVFLLRGLGADADRHATAIRYLAELPKPPMRCLKALARAALTQPKARRGYVRGLLASAPLAGVAAMAALGDPDPQIRSAAADWLAERSDRLAAGALQDQLARETAPPVRAALIAALDRLGADAPIEVDRQAFERDAKAAKSKSSKLLAFLAPQSPAIRYQGGDAVPPKALKWLLAQAVAIEAPEGSRLIDRYLDLFDPEDAVALGLWALRGWIDYDAARPSDEEATKKALKTLGLSAPPQNDESFQRAKARAFSKYVRNGFSARGVLALAARAPDAEAGFQIRAYLERHGTRSGTRVAQAGALLELAAAIGGPACLEALAWTARQTKHEGLANQASEQLESVRIARGWTEDELADRIAPDLGFDQEGAQAIPVRADAPPYRARLDDALALQLLNPAGKPVKALPAGKDPEAKAARQRVSELKKQLTATLSAQTDRLFGAMCVERVWLLQDWRRFVHDHPIVGRLAHRLVWLAGADADAFRPTPEGDLTDAADGPVALEDDARIRLAHAALIHPEHAAAWTSHFADYEVTPPFAQFGRPIQRLAAPPAARETRLTERAGWRMDAATAMKNARARGFEPAGTGRHYLYEYAFPTLRRSIAGVVASLTPNGPPPQEGGVVTLTGVEFDRPLKALPPILLSEVWNDYLDITASAAAP